MGHIHFAQHFAKKLDSSPTDTKNVTSTSNDNCHDSKIVLAYDNLSGDVLFVAPLQEQITKLIPYKNTFYAQDFLEKRKKPPRSS